MCGIEEARRYERLAKVGNKPRKNYLEAASIYALHSKDKQYEQKAKECFFNATGQKGLSIRSIAQKCLEYEDNTKRIEKLISEGKRSEQRDPKLAAKNYLLAAKLLIEESSDEPKLEDEYVALANKMYLKAKELKNAKTEIIYFSQNKGGFGDVGGLDDLKEEIRFKIIEPFLKPELYKFYNKSVGGGIIMYGPPGCGKSLIAKATAAEANATFIHVKGSDLKSKYVGETEQNIAELFAKAREKQPAIIFFDEFEALGGDRSRGATHEKNAVAQLLTEIDGVDGKNDQILLLAATNEPWSIDPALRREGRFGDTIFVPQPDAKARRHIFDIILKKRPTENLDLDLLSIKTKGLSGADIKWICERATDIPLKESFRNGTMRKINMKDLLSVIPQVQSVMEQWFDKAEKQVKSRNLEEVFSELVNEEDNASARI